MVACLVRCGDGCNRYAEEFAAEAGVAVLLFDYRGFGSSEVLRAKNIGALSFFQRLNCTCCVCLSLSLSVSVCVLGGGVPVNVYVCVLSKAPVSSRCAVSFCMVVFRAPCGTLWIWTCTSTTIDSPVPDHPKVRARVQRSPS